MLALLLLAAPAQAASLEELFAVCEYALSADDAAPLDAYGLTAVDAARRRGRVAVEGGTVSVTVDLRGDGVGDCAVDGYDPARPVSAMRPSVDWRGSEVRVRQWFAARAAGPDAYPLELESEREALAICPEDAPGYLLVGGALPRFSGDQPRADRPLAFFARRALGPEFKPCDLIREG